MSIRTLVRQLPSCTIAPWNSSQGASGSDEHVRTRQKRRSGLFTWKVPMCTLKMRTMMMMLLLLLLRGCGGKLMR